jgi:hypothetical protein
LPKTQWMGPVKSKAPACTWIVQLLLYRKFHTVQGG